MVRGKGLFALGISLTMILSLCSYLIWSAGPMLALHRSPDRALCRLHDHVLCWLPNCILCWLSLWLCTCGLPLNSLSSLSKLLCRAAAVSTTFWQAICRATSYVCRADSLCFKSISSLSRGCLPLQPTLKGGEDLLDCPSPFCFSTRGEPWCSI